MAKKIDSNRSEFSILQDQLLALDEQKDDVTKKLGEVDKSYRASNDVVKELKKSIKVPYDSDKNKTRPNRKEQLKYLLDSRYPYLHGLHPLDLDKLMALQ